MYRITSMKKKGGFTLLELLVVIAIIAILAAILFPVFARAREKARQISCLSNIKQLALAIIMYADDFDGYYVPAMDEANLMRWHGVRSTVDDPFDPTRGPLYPYLQNGQLNKCPSFFPAEAGFEQGTGGYGYNEQYVGGSPLGWPDMLRPANISQIRNPTDTIMLTDSAFIDEKGRIIEYSFCEAPFYEAWGNSKADPTTQFRHNEVANTAFCDGHAKAMHVGVVHASGWTFAVEDFRSANLGFIGNDNSLYDRK